MAYRSGRHFLQIPGPTNVPDRVLRAIDMPTMDHRGPEFGRMGLEILAGLQRIFRTDQPVVIYPASGTGAWEAALVNTLSAGDKVLMLARAAGASVFYSREATAINTAVFRLSSEEVRVLPQSGWQAGGLRAVWAVTAPFRLRSPWLWAKRLICHPRKSGG